MSISWTMVAAAAMGGVAFLALRERYVGNPAYAPGYRLELSHTTPTPYSPIVERSIQQYVPDYRGDVSTAIGGFVR